MRAIIAGFFGVLLVIGCSNNPVGPTDGSGWATVSIQGVGANSDTPKMFVEVTCAGQDTIRDTINQGGNGTSRTYKSLEPYQVWTVAVRAFDAKDSMTYQGSSEFRTDPNKTTNVTVELQSRYFKLSGHVHPVGPAVTRIDLIVNGITTTTTFAAGTHNGDTVLAVADYIPAHSRYIIEGKIYGMVNESEVLTNSGDTTVLIPWYTDQSVNLALAWQDGQPTVGSAINLRLEPGISNTTYGRIGIPLQFSGTGHYYDAILAPQGISWPDAKKHAESLTYKGLRGHLATISSAAENEFIFRNLASKSSSSNLWIGAYQSPTTTDPAANWNWLTGEPWGFENWSANEPNDFKAIDEVEMVMWCYSGKWNDSRGKIGGFIIEYE